MYDTAEILISGINGNEDLIAYLQRAFGYSLTGLIWEQILLFLHGIGANGKSVFLEILIALLGEYAVSTIIETIIVKQRGIPNDVARLAGARVVAVSETAEGQRLNESLVKDLTGGDTVTARFLHREFFDFRPEFKLWIRGNHHPQIRGTDDGIWRRIHLIPFTVQIREGERDKGLTDKLREELPGILAWAVKGCLEWQRTGLRAPVEVLNAVQGYRKEMDTLGTFLDERCVIGNEFSITAKELYAAYTEWCKTAGEHQASQKRFGMALTERGLNRDHIRGGSLCRKIGLGVNDVNDCEPLSGISPYPRARYENNTDFGTHQTQGSQEVDADEDETPEMQSGRYNQQA